MSQETTAELAASGFRYQQSHQNDLLGAAVAKDVISVIKDDGLIKHSAQTGAAFLSDLRVLADHPAITEVRGRGLMMAVGFRDAESGKEVYEGLLKRHYLVCPQLRPSLIP